MAQNAALRDELLALAAKDQAVRTALAADGSLFQGYHRRMAEVHRHNALRLAAVLAEHGWPGRSLVGADGAAAAWTILQHAIGQPALLRRGLELLRQAAARGEAPAAQVALLDDRIRTLEGRPQVYGTQHDWDARGQLSPLSVEDPASVEERRRAVGLEPLADQTARLREAARREGDGPPPDFAARQRQREQWARAAGWRH